MVLDVWQLSSEIYRNDALPYRSALKLFRFPQVLEKFDHFPPLICNCLLKIESNRMCFVELLSKFLRNGFEKYRNEWQGYQSQIMANVSAF
jgi:hypothetical protein